MLLAGLALATIAASLGLSWLLQGIKSGADLGGPHQQWHGVVVQHQEGNLLFTSVVLQYALVVGFIDTHNPSATFTVQVDAAIYNAVPDGKLITLDLGPQTGHVYALATSNDGVTWSHEDLDPGSAQLRLLCWLLLGFGGGLSLLGLVGLALLVMGAADLLGGTDLVTGVVVDVAEGSFWHLSSVVVDRGAGPLKPLALRQSMYEKVCEDGGRSQMTFIVSRLLHHVRRAKRYRSGEKGPGRREQEWPRETLAEPGGSRDRHVPRQSRQYYR
jgi:hypothetical protein